MAKASETRAASMRKRWEDPEFRERMTKVRKETWQRPGYRAHMSERLSKLASSRTGESNGHYAHGYYKQPEFWAFFSAKQRCTNPNNPQYPNYGGRGLTFEFASFADFLDHIGPRPSKSHSLDRINNNVGYVVGNVRWTNGKVQILNRRPNRWKCLTCGTPTVCLHCNPLPVEQVPEYGLSAC